MFIHPDGFTVLARRTIEMSAEVRTARTIACLPAQTHMARQ